MGLQKCTLNLNRAFKELQPHGTLEFPCAGYNKPYTDSADDVIVWHWHEELEIVYIKEGHLKLQIPGKTFHLTGGQGFVINSNILHFAVAEPYCELHSLVFHPLLITGNEDSVFARKYMTPLVKCTSFDGCLLDGDSPTDHFTAAFSALSSDAPGCEFTVREHLSSIIFYLCQKYGQEIGGDCAEPDQDTIRIRKMLDYIHSHYSESLELAQIAKAADIGERECLRCFQRAIQISPMQYLLKYRITQGASMLLQNPGSSIAEVSSQCGFDSPSNFSQMFKRFFTCTPREYRRRNPT